MFGISMKGAAALAGAVALTSTAAQADELLLIDLSIADQVTITATPGLSAVSLTGSDTTGVYFENFFNVSTASTNTIGGGVGDLSTAGQASDGSPGLFNFAGDTGLNFWSWTNESAAFSAGTQAFEDSGTWAVSSAFYADLLNNNGTGDLYFPADTGDDITIGVDILGTYRVIPTPGTISLAGLACGLVGARRRR